VARSSPPRPINNDNYSESNDGSGLREILHILLKRKWLIIITFLIVFLTVALYTFSRTPIFRSSATLQLTQDNPASQVMEDKFSKLTTFEDLEKFQQTQYKILQSWSLAERVFHALNFKDHADFQLIRKNNPNMTDAQIEEAMIDLLMATIEVNPVKNSFLVEVAFQSPDKFQAQRVVNTIADEFMFLSIDRRNASFALVRKWLDKQLQEMATKVQEAQKKLYKFVQKTDIYTLEDKDNIVVQKFIDISSLVTKAQAEKMAKEAQYKQIKDKGPNAPLIVNNPLVSQLRQQLVVQQAKVSSLKKVYRKEHPELLVEKANLAELQARLQAEVQRLQESAKADYEVANRTEQLLSGSFSNQKGQMAKLQDNLTDFKILQRDAQANEQLYQALLARVKEANIAGTMVPTNVAVIDPARLPDKPFKPKSKRDLALASVLGLTLGVGLAFLIEYLDDSIKSVEDLEQSCNLPSLGVLPFLGSNGRMFFDHRKKLEEKGVWSYFPLRLRRRQAFVESEDQDLVVLKHPRSLASEAIRHAHTSIMLSLSGRPPRAIMVSSPNPSEGKTMVTSNLALTFALGGNQTVLIDCDLRRPRVHKIFQLDLQPGLSNYLAGTTTLEEILRSTSAPNLSIITAGSAPPSPGILLNSKEFKDLLAQLRHRFDHIVIDTPPILGFSESLIISVLTDGVLLVVKQNFTHKSAGRMAQQRLSQVHAPTMGVLLNFADAHGQAYGSNYYHGHYKYYSKYYDDQRTD
jgi:capsular exopolysaccharide synthesis family protein